MGVQSADFSGVGLVIVVVVLAVFAYIFMAPKKRKRKVRGRKGRRGGTGNRDEYEGYEKKQDTRTKEEVMASLKKLEGKWHGLELWQMILLVVSSLVVIFLAVAGVFG